MDPSLHPSLVTITLRLVLTFAAGALIGVNREARGHAAGLRTTLLVCLAASVAMIQMDLLLPIAGKTPSSFAVLDLMRLPLGILTGVGFIGGGAILKRGSLLIGVTTASTLWITTVIGLCIGGGQLLLGAAATAIALFVLWGMKWVDRRLPRLQRGVLSITETAEAQPFEHLDRPLGDAELRLIDRRWEKGQGHRVSRYETRFKGEESVLLERIAQVADGPNTAAVQWSSNPG